ncbi:MAG: hypothetical protein CME70_00995 [Halobacteriovorax sp.]|nr:hypothetical protein [Halobacteriovorax sp.]
MSEFGRYFLDYFEKRFPFFDFTLPLILLLYPIIPSLVPLYFLPKYYGLHFLYLFLMLFNLRLHRDFSEGLHIKSFKKYFIGLIGLSAILLLLFSVLFTYLERGQFDADIRFNWRSFFFFLSSASLLVFNALWYFIGSKMITKPLVSFSIASLRFPLLLVPPLFLNLHESQTAAVLLLLGFVFFHCLAFELYKEKNTVVAYVRYFFVMLYGCMMGLCALEAELGYLFLGLVLLGTIGLIIFDKKMDQRILFGPSIIFSWSYLALTIV